MKAPADAARRVFHSVAHQPKSAWKFACLAYQLHHQTTTTARAFFDVSLFWRLSGPEGKAAAEARLEDMEAVGASRGSEP